VKSFGLNGAKPAVRDHGLCRVNDLIAFTDILNYLFFVVVVVVVVSLISTDAPSEVLTKGA